MSKSRMTFGSSTVLVSGGAGFIGSNFIRYILSEHGRAKVVNLDKLTYSGNPDNLKDIASGSRYTFVKGDIADKRMLDAVFIKFRPSFVVNFSAETHVDRSIHIGALEFVKTNVEGVFNILEAVKRHKGIEKYVQVSCYDGKTRAWTKKGLKYYWELRDDDEVLTLNKNGRPEIQRVEKVIVQDYKGQMISFDNGKVDLLVTPNHRMMDSSYNFLDAERARGGIKFPNAIALDKYGAGGIKIDGFGTVTHQKLFDLLYIVGVFIGDGFTAYQEKKVKSRTGLNKSEFLKKAKNSKGIFIKLGRVGENDYVISRSWRVFFDVPEKDKAREGLENSLKLLDIEFSRHKGKSGEHIYFNSEKYVKFFDKNCGRGAYNKSIPEWAFDLPSDLLERLFKGLIDSDGYWRKNGVSQFTTISGELVKGIVELSTRLGRTVSVKKTHSESYIDGRKISGEAYQVLIGNGSGKTIHAKSVKSVAYDGKVWCIKVENKNFLVERNGKYGFCGNTDEVYGTLDLKSPNKFKEDTAFAPNVPYAATKAGGDLLCRAYYSTWKVPVAVTHCSNNYGPYQYPEKLIPFFILRMLEGKKLPLYGDGKNVRDWIYVLDHCRALEICLLKGVPGEVYNIGADNEKSNLEIARLILRHFGRDESRIEFVADRPGHDRRYAVDSAKIRKELGWRPSYDFGEKLKETIQWYIDNPGWIKNVRRRTGVFNPHIDLWKAHESNQKLKSKNQKK